MPNSLFTTDASQETSRHRVKNRERCASPLTALLMTCALALATTLGGASAAQAGGDWNDAGIAWQSYDAGLAMAKESKKPIALIFYTDWCPHCTSYSGLFKDPRLVEKSKEFVMIRVERDSNQELSARYAPDGQYIPRTFFLSSGGKLLPEVQEQRPSYKYFYDTSAPDSVLRSMDEVLEKSKPDATQK